MTRRLFHRRPRLSLAATLALILVSGGSAGGSLADARAVAGSYYRPPDSLTVLTYNVHGLPWPVALDRTSALRRIGERLAEMRRWGAQPDVVVLQEAFVDEAKAIGAEAGYRFRVLGPAATAASGLPGDPHIDRSWYLGETQGKILDSGLVILSDFPVSRIRRLAFSDSDCAGFDCLAAKGAVIVDLALPGGRQASVATTHLNSGKASHAGGAASDAAFARESQRLSQFVSASRTSGVPLILAGDFNRKNRSARLDAFGPALATANGGRRPASGLDSCLANRACPAPRDAETAAIVKRADDFQFALNGQGVALVPVAASVPFPLNGGLSDHAGVAVSYRFQRTQMR